jgi:hypothetical protein
MALVIGRVMVSIVFSTIATEKFLSTGHVWRVVQEFITNVAFVWTVDINHSGVASIERKRPRPDAYASLISY